MAASPHIPPAIQRLVLAGFMGSGKTTVGRVLARRLQWRFADLDETVAAQEGMSVPQLFATRGEAVFRQAEVTALLGLLGQTGMVIALGGGAPETASIRALLTETSGTTVVHLHAPFRVLYDRCVAQASNPAATARPLLGAAQDAEERYNRRLPLYTCLAHHTANAGQGSPEATANEILAHLNG